VPSDTNPETPEPRTLLDAAITREIATKGDAARFRKAGRGQFTAAAHTTK